jgi:hypothetical protein
MHDQLAKFKAITKENFSRPDFEYHEWLFEYHLEIVKKIAMELCDIYKDADRDLVEAMVWFHDFGKPLDRKNERAVTVVEGPRVMRECGFPEEFIQKTIEYWKLMEQKNDIDIRTTPIEVQIVSTADGASHFTGVFYSSYWADGLSFTETQEELRAKITKDWERKIVLPEARAAFLGHYNRALEMLGEFPGRFI